MDAFNGGADGRSEETLIVFDWDDTILPTSWLERIHALDAGGMAALRPEVQRQLNTLVQACQQTLALAATLGKVILITNSAPGWVDQSCRLFVPQLSEQVSKLPIFAKPMHVPVTFKIGAFKRECRAHRNIVSVGDGDAERDAMMRLQGPMDRKGSFAIGGGGQGKFLKSVKLIDLPTCMQIVVQHGLIQERLADIAAFQGSLDLKTRFVAAVNVNNLGFGSPVGSGAAAAKASCCTLVHFGRPPPDMRGGVMALGGSVGSAQGGSVGQALDRPPPAHAAAAPEQAKPQGVEAVGLRTPQRAPHRQLPPMSRTPSLPGGEATKPLDGSPQAVSGRPLGAASPAANDAGDAPESAASQKGADGAGGGQAGVRPAADAATASALRMQQQLMVPQPQTGSSEETTPKLGAAGAADGSDGPISNLGIWKVQPGVVQASPGRPLYPGKKRPVMVPQLKGSSVAVWRDNSSPPRGSVCLGGGGSSPAAKERAVLAGAF